MFLVKDSDINAAIQNLSGSASIELMAKAADLKSQGIKVCDLSGGEPDFDTPPAITRAAIEALSAGHTHYLVGRGHKDLRARICQEYAEQQGLSIASDQIIITPGAKFALYLALRTLLNPGDEVLIPTPSWLSYFPMVAACEAGTVEIPLSPESNYELTEELLERGMTPKVKALILNYPNNPSGKCLSDYARDQLLSFMRRHPQVYVIFDEIYRDICYEPFQNAGLTDPISLAADAALQSRVIRINGFSKSHAMTGWRIGYMIADQTVSRHAYKLFSHSITGVATFIQEAAIVAYDQQEEVRSMLESYRARRRFMVESLRQIEGFSLQAPEGTFYLWLKFQYKDMQAEEFADYLLDKVNVLLVPGSAYGSHCEQYLRLSFASPMEDLREALRRIETAWQEG